MPSKVHLSRLCLSHTHDVAATGRAHLLSLVRRIADRDRVAFADLCDRLSVPILRAVRSSVPDPEAAAIVVATQMEVWWMARFHTGPETDVQVWLDDIVGRRVRDRAAPRTSVTLLDRVYDRHTSLVLAGVLGRRLVA